MKLLILLIIAIPLYGILLGGSVLFWQEKFQASLVPRLNLDNDKDSITLLFVGDIMLDRGVEFYMTQRNDWKLPFLRIADTLQKADLVFGNLESVISNKGENLGSIYSFRANPKALEGLLFAGFDVLSVANNHSLDYGSEALIDSLQRLKKAGITPVGGGNSRNEAHAPALKHYYTLKYSSITTVGILAYTATGSPLWRATENTPGVAWVDEETLPEFQESIRIAKQRSDILVVSVHWGEEYQTQPNETQKLIAKSAIDGGADIVIGHHPHMIQPVEYVCNQVTHICGWIAYSLGNFVFDQGFSPETMEGLLLEVKVERKQITQVIPRVIRMNSSFQPKLE